MQNNLLLWGFQDLNFLSELGRKFRYSLPIKELYVQINDMEKTMSLIDLFPEEVIRTKHDLSYLYHWLNRTNKKNIIVVIDLFTIIYHEKFDENFEHLRELLKLDVKFCFFSPKLLSPQGLKFIENQETKLMFNKLLNINRNFKKYIEIIFNSGSNCQILFSSVLEEYNLNQTKYLLFQTRLNWNIMFTNNVLNKYNFLYLKKTQAVSNIIEFISKILNIKEKEKLELFQEVKSKFSVLEYPKIKNITQFFRPKISFPMEHFYKVKNKPVEANFLLWILFLSLADYQVELEKSNTHIKLLADHFFFAQPEG